MIVIDNKKVRGGADTDTPNLYKRQKDKIPGIFVFGGVGWYTYFVKFFQWI